MKQTIPIRRFLSILVAAVVLAGLLYVPAVQTVSAAESTVSTSITGLKKTNKASYNKTLKNTVTVTPAYGRKIELSRYDAFQKKWIKEKTIKTENVRSAKVTVKFPAVWKTAGSMKWRITAPQKKVKVDGVEQTLRAKTVKTTTKCSFLKAKAAVVLDASTGKCVYQYNPTAKRKVASITKMMTMILLAENKSPSDKVKINWEAEDARKKSGGIGLRSGDTLTVKDLMYCALLPSANDAAAASAVAVSGSQEKFKKKMKAKAVSLGATDTTYVYAFGDWYGNAKSTAFDQALIGREFMTSPKTSLLRQIVKTRTYKFTTEKGRTYNVNSYDAGNLVLGKKGSIGIKSGYNPPAGRCFANAWYYKGRLYISVILGEPSAKQLWKDVLKLTTASNYLRDHKVKEITVKKVK